MTVDSNTLFTVVVGFFTTVFGALLLWFLKDNTDSSRKLREEVIVLKTQLEPIKEAVRQMPVVLDLAGKTQKDLQVYFGRLKKIEKKIGIDSIDEF